MECFAADYAARVDGAAREKEYSRLSEQLKKHDLSRRTIVARTEKSREERARNESEEERQNAQTREDRETLEAIDRANDVPIVDVVGQDDVYFAEFFEGAWSGVDCAAVSGGSLRGARHHFTR
jgi:hypothetical protein